MTRTQIKALASRTDDAYSFSTYGEREWIRAIRLLADRGYNERAIEAILRSKYTRWAADARTTNAKPRGEDVLIFIMDPRNKVTRADVITLAQMTFNDNSIDIGNPEGPRVPTGDDLAGACEGEDIAALIDLARMVNNGVTGPRIQQIAGSLLARIEERAK